MPIDKSFPSAYNSNDGSEHEGAASNFNQSSTATEAPKPASYDSASIRGVGEATEVANMIYTLRMYGPRPKNMGKNTGDMSDD